ncbi:MAG TPA: hypothetical protein VN519_06805 [Bryobacteraceae bacterium]|nr:hypothetical protein [Bryobacteraceae bacterium]
MLYWVADQMGVWAGDLQDMDPVEGGKFLALCQSLGSSRTKYLEALIRQMSTLISILSRPATPSI